MDPRTKWLWAIQCFKLLNCLKNCEKTKFHFKFHFFQILNFFCSHFWVVQNFSALKIKIASISYRWLIKYGIYSYFTLFLPIYILWSWKLLLYRLNCNLCEICISVFVCLHTNIQIIYWIIERTCVCVCVRVNLDPFHRPIW